MTILPTHAPLAVATRGDTVESIHFGSVAVVDVDGRLRSFCGDPLTATFTRSTLKPFQAIPFVRDGGIERFGYSQPQVALLCASHSGEPRHVTAAAQMLESAGNTSEHLQCGAHVPGFYELRGEVPPPPPYSPLAHNCSGKHAGMLACCTLHGWSKEDYIGFGHPLQAQIRATVADFTGVPAERLLRGVDGCSAPNYALPIAGLALAYARLASAEGDDSRHGRAAARLRDAMAAHPGMVSGEGRSDLTLALAGGGDWVPKIGAEGVQAIGIRSLGLGIAVKVGDGGKRALLPAVVAVLDQLGLLDTDRRKRLETMTGSTIRNYRGTATGRVEPVLVLDSPPSGTRDLP